MTTKSAPEPRKKWLRVSVTSPKILMEPVAGILTRLSGRGVEIDDREEKDKKSTVIGYFSLDSEDDSTDANAGKIFNHLDRIKKECEELTLLSESGSPEIASEIIVEEDWSNQWKDFFRPFEIIPGLVIKPSWAEYRPKKGRRVIEMDPGMAFGTGHHPSTRMALSLLHSVFPDKTPGRVLDVGTGTGILAMAAAVFGSERVICLDNDPDAVAVAIGNIHRNRFDHIIQVGNTPLADLKGSFDLICANIVLDVLVDMARDFDRLLNADGRLILAGILKGDQEKNLREIYGKLQYRLLLTKYDGEWAALLFEKRIVSTLQF